MKKIITIIAMFMLMAMNAAAYTQIWNIEGNMPFTGRTYLCEGECTDTNLIGSSMQQETGEDITLTFTGDATYSDPDYYAIYYYPEDACHVPTVFAYGIYGNAEYDLSQDFGKQDPDFCGSNVANIAATTYDASIGETVSVGAQLQSAWGTDFDYVPDALDNYYDSFVEVNFSVNGEVVETRDIRIGWDEWEYVEFDFTPTEAGDYTLRISTKMDDDCKCDLREDGTRSNLKYQEVDVHVTTSEIPEFTVLGMVSVSLIAGLFIYLRR